MKKVLVATEKPFAKVAVDGIRRILEGAGYDLVLLEKYTDKADLLKAVADVDGLIIRSDKASKEVIEAGKNLKIVVRAGAGYDNIDLAACTANGVVAMNTPGQNSNAVAELAIGMMVYMARNGFQPGTGSELKGKKIGFHAFGYVGKYVAKIAKGFGMDLYAFDPFIAKETIINEGAKPVDSVEELYKTCQYISLHVPATEKTKKSINYDLLSLMPEGAVIINTARAEVMDDEGLLKIFETRKDFKYLSDVEPTCKAQLAEKYANRYFCTPKKMGAETEEANINAGLASAQQIVNFLEKGDKTFQVNK